jgi:hypothetical protein
MASVAELKLPSGLASELEQKYFWWEPVGSHPRSEARILAQAMHLAPFAEVRRLETSLGAETLAAVMRHAEPGWFDGRSWEFWRGRLARAAGQRLPEAPPRRSFGG